MNTYHRVQEHCCYTGEAEVCCHEDLGNKHEVCDKPWKANACALLECAVLSILLE